MVLDNWSNDKKGLSKFKGFIKSKEPIKPRFEEAQRKLRLQIANLEMISQRLKEKEQTLFARIVKGMRERDMQTATMLSNELAQIRKLKNTVNYSKLALEQINLRMNTMTDLGDIVVTLSPAMSIVNNVKNDISVMMPEFNNEISAVNNILNELMINSSEIPNGTQLPVNQLTNNEDVQQILDEATALVEKDVKNRLPELPMNMQSKEPPFKNIKGSKKYPDLPSTRKKKVEAAT